MTGEQRQHGVAAAGAFHRGGRQGDEHVDLGDAEWRQAGETLWLGLLESVQQDGAGGGAAVRRVKGTWCWILNGDPGFVRPRQQVRAGPKPAIHRMTNNTKPLPMCPV